MLITKPKHTTNSLVVELPYHTAITALPKPSQVIRPGGYPLLSESVRTRRAAAIADRQQ